MFPKPTIKYLFMPRKVINSKKNLIGYFLCIFAVHPIYYMLSRKDKYFVLVILFFFQIICIQAYKSVWPVCWIQIDLLRNLFDEDKALVLPAAFIYFGEMILLLSLLQRQIPFFNLLSWVGLGALGTTVLLLGIVTTKPFLVFGTAIPFIVLAIVFIIRMWRKADMEKYIVNDK